MKLGTNNTKTTVNVKATKQLYEEARDKNKLWHGEGFFWLLASKTSKDSHAFYFRHTETKKRKVLRDDTGRTIRPQSIAGIGSDDYTVFESLEQVEEIARKRAGVPLPVKQAGASVLQQRSRQHEYRRPSRRDALRERMDGEARERDHEGRRRGTARRDRSRTLHEPALA
jgi:hypothetical protein